MQKESAGMRVRLHPKGYIEICCFESVVTAASLTKGLEKIVTLEEDLIRQKKPVLILTDFSNVREFKSDARNLLQQALKSLSFTKAARLGVREETYERVKSAYTSREQLGRTRNFANREEAEKWLLG